MKRSAQIKATTQRFTEIHDIYGETVILTNGSACQIIEVTATNFALQSEEEQRTKIASYGSLLNSLSFSIQVFITNKKLDISTYLRSLDEQIKKTSNPNLSQQMTLYKNFVANLIKVNTVLDKRFYIVIPYSPLEKGVTGAKAASLGVAADSSVINQAKVSLKSKSETLLSEVLRLNLKARILNKDDLIKVFYEIYNGSVSQGIKFSEYKTPIVEGPPSLKATEGQASQ